MNKFFRISAVLSALLIAAGVATAQTSVTSTVGGGSSSYAQVTGVNQGSSAGSIAASQNQANASGAALGGIPVLNYYNAGATSQANTTGQTANGAYVIGQGSAAAGADQSGTATNTSTANAIKPAGSLFGIPYGNGGNVGSVQTNSVAQVATGSGTQITNTGAGASGTNANAFNNSAATVNAPVAGTSNAVGATGGNAVATTWGVSTQPAGNTAGGGLTVGTATGVGAFQNGGYTGTITRP